MARIYTPEHDEWLRENSRKSWRTEQEFTDAFNKQFGLSVTVSSLVSRMARQDIPAINSKEDKSFVRMTEEEAQWILDNKDLGIFRNQKHFTDTFNAIFNANKTVRAMNTYLFKHGISVKTPNNTSHYTEEMENWLKDNYSNYDNDWVALAADFNTKFGVDYSNVRLAKYCQRHLKIHVPSKKTGRVNKGTFVKGNARHSTDNQLPIGTVRTYTSHSTKLLYIKVKLTEGDSGLLRDTGHNYKRPWWIPLKEKVWIDAYGEIPEGYSIIQLDRDYKNCDLSNLALADKRGLAIMGSHKWWTENATFNKTGIQWCNLYMTAKDKGIYNNASDKILQ